MALPLWHRAVLVLLGAALATPLFGAFAANAGTTEVTFSGRPLLDLSTLACPSTPSRSTLRVAARQTVDFINRTGRTATLHVGAGQRLMPDKSVVPVTFLDGPAAIVVQMVPDCTLDLGKHNLMVIQVRALSKPSPRINMSASASSGSVRAPVVSGPSELATAAVFGRTSGPTRTRRASVLLMLIATAAVIGVAAAAIRAVIARRANSSLNM